MKDYKLKQRNLRASHTLGWSYKEIHYSGDTMYTYTCIFGWIQSESEFQVLNRGQGSGTSGRRKAF